MIYALITALFLIAFVLREWAITRERKDWRAERKDFGERLTKHEETAAAERKEMREQFAKAEEDWANERRELLTRIQRPELVPVERLNGENPPEPIPFDPGAWGEPPPIDDGG